MEASPQPTLDPLTRWLLAAQSNLARLFLALAILWSVPTLYGAAKLIRGDGVKAAEIKPDESPDAAPEAKPEVKPEAKFDPNRPNYFALAILGGVGALAALGGALWWFAQPQDQNETARRLQVRVAVLLAGVGSGLLLMLGGLWFVFDKYEVLSKWLDTRESKELWKALVPVLVFVFGAGLAFVAAQAARPEERNSQLTRRLVYATNLVVTVLLLFVGLGVLNIFFGTKLPNRLDTTGSGFYTLSPSTEVFVKSLDQKVTVYSFLEEQYRGEEAMRILLENCQDANPAKFILKHYGTTIAAKDAQRIRTAFPQVNLDDTAFIIAMGEDEKRFSTVKHSDLTSATRDERGRVKSQEFSGERALVRELQFLADNQAKATVYFTQGSGELAISPGPEQLRDRSIGQLRAHLEKLNVNVLPLEFDRKTPKVPDDAAVVIVANPTVPFTPEMSLELKRYMTDPRPDGKKGKLIVLAGPNATPKNDAIQPTGLEDLLNGFGIKLLPKIVMNPPTRNSPADNATCGVPALRGGQSDNPILRPLTELGQTFPFGRCRPMDVAPPQQQQPGGMEAYPLVITATSRNFPNWLEDVRPADPDKAFETVFSSEELLRQKGVTARPRIVAAAAQEGTTGRLVVFGSTLYFLDSTAAALGTQPEANPGNVMIVSAIDWLRDRPVVDVANKAYGTYKPNAGAESMRLLVLPLCLIALAIIGFGAGTWVIRRK